MASPCNHRWDLERAEVLSSDRFHLYYNCAYCGTEARQAWGTSQGHAAKSRRNGPQLFAKNLPIVERHFVIGEGAQ